MNAVSWVSSLLVFEQEFLVRFWHDEHVYLSVFFINIILIVCELLSRESCSKE
jgi:hypothetical protein